MNQTFRSALLLVLPVAIICAAPLVRAEEEVIVTLEPIEVEATFDLQLELRQRAREIELAEKLRQQTEIQRGIELQDLNKSFVSRLLDLTKFSPIPLGSSESRLDTFFLQNHMRADFNPRRNEGVLFR